MKGRKGSVDIFNGNFAKIDLKPAKKSQLPEITQ
jgi:hypothetical protein